MIQNRRTSSSKPVETLEARTLMAATLNASVFRDVSGDGVHQVNSELTMPGWTVFLDADADDSLDAGETSGVTDFNGRASFSVAPGTYRLAVVVPPAWVGTTPPAARTVTVADGATTNVALGLVSASPQRHPTPIGPEYDLREPGDTSSRDAVSMGSDSAGNFVAVWSSSGVSQVRGRRFDAAGNPLGAAFAVSTSGSVDSFETPTVAVAPNGTFVVAWATFNQILARPFAADGTPLAGEIVVTSSSNSESPHVAITPGGDFFAVTWNGQIGSDFDVVAIRMFDITGTQPTLTVRVNETGSFGQAPGGIVFDSAGRATVAYLDGSASRFAARRFTLSGTADGPSFVVDAGSGSFDPNIDVAINSAGERLFVFQRSTRQYGRVFAPDNTPRGGAFPLGTSIPTSLAPPEATALTDGSFVAVWQTANVTVNGGAVGQLVNADGAPHGREFRLATTAATSWPSHLDVAAGPGATFTAAWGTTFADVGVRAQRFQTYGDDQRVSVGGRVFDDRDRDGIQDAGDAGLANEVLELRNEFGSIADTARTDAAGNYQFNALKAGNFYEVWAPQVNSALRTLSPANQGGDDAVDSDFDPPFARTNAFVVNTGDPPVTFDAGVINFPPRVTEVFVAGTAWTSAYRDSLVASGQGESAFGYRIPAASQTAILPWSNLNRISVRFNEAVNVASDDLVVNGVNVAVYGVANFAYDANTRTATWTLDRAVPNDKITLTLEADAGGVTDANGHALDGEWTNPVPPATSGDTFPSGDGNDGGDFIFDFRVLPGDVNRDGNVNVFDFNILKPNLNLPNRGVLGGDVNGDNTVNIFDFNDFKTYLGKTVPA